MLTQVLESIRQRMKNAYPAGVPRVALALGALVFVIFLASSAIVAVEPGQGAVRINRLTGSVTVVPERWSLAIPGVTRVVRFPIREQVFRSEHGARASAPGAFQS